MSKEELPNPVKIDSQSSETPRAEAAAIAMQAVPGEHLLKLLTTQVAHDIDKLIDARERRRFQTFTIIVALLALLGLGSVVAIATNFAEQLVRDVFEERYGEFDARTATLLEQLEFETVYQQFIALSQSFVDEEVGGIVNSERETLMQILERLSEAGELLAGRETFPTFLARVVDAATGAELGADVDTLDSLFRSTLTAHADSVQMMATHYGRVVLGSASPFDAQPSERFGRLQAYLEAADQGESPEESILWNLLMEFQRNDYRSNEATNDYVESVNYLEAENERSFHSYLVLLSDPDLYQRERTSEGTLVARKVEQLLDVYPQLRNGADEQRPVVEAAAERINPRSRLDELLGMGRGQRGGERSDAEGFLSLALMIVADDWTQVDTITGELEEGASTSTVIQESTEEGREYRLVGACDRSCRDLDLSFFAGDVEVDEDVAEDDVPDVRYTATGAEQLTVDVAMFECRASSCEYAVAVLERRP